MMYVTITWIDVIFILKSRSLIERKHTDHQFKFQYPWKPFQFRIFFTVRLQSRHTITSCFTKAQNRQGCCPIRESSEKKILKYPLRPNGIQKGINELKGVRFEIFFKSIYIFPNAILHLFPFVLFISMSLEISGSPGLPIQMENPFHTVYMLFKSTGHHLESTIQDWEFGKYWSVALLFA